MVLNNIKDNRKDHGFTIVELLVVIAVIGILAAITLVSYIGVTAKANTAKAQSNAQAAQSIVETYYAEMGYYPGINATFLTGSTSGTAKLPANLSIVADAATTPLNGAVYDANDSKIALSCVTAAASCVAGETAKNITGLRFGYWNYSTSVENFIYSGTAAASGSSYVY
jgi:type IV pilus assembly protein PilA